MAKRESSIEIDQIVLVSKGQVVYLSNVTSFRIIPGDTIQATIRIDKDTAIFEAIEIERQLTERIKVQ